MLPFQLVLQMVSDKLHLFPQILVLKTWRVFTIGIPKMEQESGALERLELWTLHRALNLSRPNAWVFVHFNSISSILTFVVGLGEAAFYCSSGSGNHWLHLFPLMWEEKVVLGFKKVQLCCKTLIFYLNIHIPTYLILGRKIYNFFVKLGNIAIRNHIFVVLRKTGLVVIFLIE